MSLLDNLGNSKLSLVGNDFNPTPGKADWGFYSSKQKPEDIVDVKASKLHYQYSVNYLEGNGGRGTTGEEIYMKVKNYNKTAYPSYVPKESDLDPLDIDRNDLKLETILDKNRRIIQRGYNSNESYPDKGPKEGKGRY
jgi:hypothetical protein